WGRVRRCDGGDTMNVAEAMKAQADSRNASFIRYETLVDKHAHHRNVTPAYEKRTFYGRLEHIFLVHVPAHP
ncbi:hypothetical protein BU15DRAFT_27496, partial [Melanogaster broomeanus]